MSKEQPLLGSVALITGASSGIGRAAAHRLAADGASVAIVARRSDRLKELAQSIEVAGGSALVIPADVTVRSEAYAAVDATIAKFGRIDIVVNAAGVMFNAPSLEIPIEDWEMMVDVNIKGVLYIVKRALPHLLDAVSSEGGRSVTDVVNISSIAGRFARATVATYNATKFAVTAATEAWRQEFTKSGVRFCVIEPGAVSTELLEGRDYMKGYAEQLRHGIEELHAEDIADAISYAILQPRRVAVAEIVLRPTDQV